MILVVVEVDSSALIALLDVFRCRPVAFRSVRGLNLRYLLWFLLLRPTIQSLQLNRWDWWTKALLSLFLLNSEGKSRDSPFGTWEECTVSLIFFSFLYSELYEKDFGGQSAIYWEVKYPFPLSNRDVSFWLNQFKIQTIVMDLDTKHFPFELKATVFCKTKSPCEALLRIFRMSLLCQKCCSVSLDHKVLRQHLSTLGELVLELSSKKNK